jgi:ubiquinol-cytochrome c reductase cytochrome c subunit
VSGARSRSRRGRRLPRRVRVVLALALAAGSLASILLQAPSGAQQPSPSARPPDDPSVPNPPETAAAAAQVERGRQLFVDGCSSCHGYEARGIEGRGPSLRGVGEAAADFYLRTGRMPLDDPGDQPVRAESPYTHEEQLAIIAYIGQFGGPGIPEVHPERGDVSDGLRLFTDNCAGCHQVVGEGGITSMAVAPDFRETEPVDIGEAVEVAPYVMPRFADQLTQGEIDSIARYVEYAKDPVDEGGWGIGHIGPIPEGMVAWLLAGAALLLLIRLIGERTTE